LSKLKADNRKPIQVDIRTHAILTAIKADTGQPLGRIVDKMIEERFPKEELGNG